MKPYTHPYIDEAWQNVLEAEKISEELYEYKLKIYRDLKNVLDYAYESGYKEGLELAKKDKKKREVRRLKDLQLPTDIIAIAVDLSIAEVEAVLLESS